MPFSLQSPSQPFFGCHATLPRLRERLFEGRAIRKVFFGGGGGGDEEFSCHRNFFSLSNSLYEFFLGHSMNFFSFNFPSREYFFVLRPPPPPISFLMVRPLVSELPRNSANKKIRKFFLGEIIKKLTAL